MKIGFDNEKYLAEQEAAIVKRMKQFHNKLYIEFGGKLLFDYHASRVLPGFEPNVKIRLVEKFRDQADFILSKINIINGYKGYVELHAKDRELVQDLATAYADLTAKWHRFDLDEVEEDTRELLGNYRTAKAQAVKDRKSKIKR